MKVQVRGQTGEAYFDCKTEKNISVIEGKNVVKPAICEGRIGNPFYLSPEFPKNRSLRPAALLFFVDHPCEVNRT